MSFLIIGIPVPYEDYFYLQKLNLSADGGQNTVIGMYVHTITIRLM